MPWDLTGSGGPASLVLGKRYVALSAEDRRNAEELVILQGEMIRTINEAEMRVQLCQSALNKLSLLQPGAQVLGCATIPKGVPVDIYREGLKHTLQSKLSTAILFLKNAKEAARKVVPTKEFD